RSNPTPPTSQTGGKANPENDRRRAFAPFGADLALLDRSRMRPLRDVGARVPARNSRNLANPGTYCAALETWRRPALPWSAPGPSSRNGLAPITRRRPSPPEPPDRAVRTQRPQAVVGGGGFPSVFPPSDARPPGTGRSRQGRRGTAEALTCRLRTSRPIVGIMWGRERSGEATARRPVKSPALPTQVRILSLPH